jgi:hypothetical protein
MSLVIEAIGKHGVGVLFQQDRAGRLILHQYRRGLQRKPLRIIQRCPALRQFSGVELLRDAWRFLFCRNHLLFGGRLDVGRRHASADQRDRQQHQ